MGLNEPRSEYPDISLAEVLRLSQLACELAHSDPECRNPAITAGIAAINVKLAPYAQKLKEKRKQRAA